MINILAYCSLDISTGEYTKLAEIDLNVNNGFMSISERRAIQGRDWSESHTMLIGNSIYMQLNSETTCSIFRFQKSGTELVPVAVARIPVEPGTLISNINHTIGFEKLSLLLLGGTASEVSIRAIDFDLMSLSYTEDEIISWEPTISYDSFYIQLLKRSSNESIYHYDGTLYHHTETGLIGYKDVKEDLRYYRIDEDGNIFSNIGVMQLIDGDLKLVSPVRYVRNIGNDMLAGPILAGFIPPSETQEIMIYNNFKREYGD